MISGCKQQGIVIHPEWCVCVCALERDNDDNDDVRDETDREGVKEFIDDAHQA